jgi:hypothetical protein
MMICYPVIELYDDYYIMKYQKINQKIEEEKILLNQKTLR